MLNKKILESASVAVLAVILTVGSIFGGAVTETVETDANQTQMACEATTLYAGTTEYLQNVDINETVTVEKEDAEIATATPELTEEQKAWQNKVMSTLQDSSLNVRAEANAEADIVGKMEHGDLAEIVEDGVEWIKITSGNVEGYVSREYCMVGVEALDYAKENFEVVASATTNGVRVRSEANTESSVVKTLSQDACLVVASDAEAVDGWVAVTYKDTTCYVSADYVEVKMNLGTAKTMAEIAEQQKKAAAEKAAQEAAANSRAYSSANIVQGSALSYSQEDLDLLAALICCEAGNGSYDLQLGVASVVCNEVKSARFPNSIHDVIYRRGTFGPAGSGALDSALNSGRASSSCYAAAQAALSGTDNVDGAIGFMYTSSGKSGVVIGSVVFYK